MNFQLSHFLFKQPYYFNIAIDKYSFTKNVERKLLNGMSTILLFNKLKSNKTIQSSILMIAGLILYLFSNGKWIIPVFAWIAPFFLIHVFRDFKGWREILVFYIGVTVVQFIRFKGMIPGPDVFYYLTSIFGSIFILLPYFFHRWLYKKLNGFKATLIFPITAVIIEYFVASVNKHGGTFAALGYTQNNLVFLQLASLTGIWGLNFLIAWTGPLLNWLYDEQFEIVKIRQGLRIFLLVIIAVFLYGEIRINLFPSDSKTVRIASITHNQFVADSSDFTKDYSRIQPFRNQMAKIQTDVLRLTEKAADFGAKFIFMHEGSLPVLKSDEKELINKACLLAKKKNIYLGLSLFTLPREFPKKLGEAKIVWLDSKGTVIWEFLKAYPAPGDPIMAGDKEIKSFDTPYGRIGSVICFDMDFPSFINQTGKKDIDIMLVPAHDWKMIDQYHSNMAKLRAIENGFSMVRCTGDGITLVTDYHGKTLGQLNSFNTKENIMISDVPIKGTVTLYTKTGDIFVWICIFGFLIILWRAFYKRKLEE